MSTLRRTYLLVVPVLASPLTPRCALAQLTPAEEAIVRSTYAKLSLATSTGIVADALINHAIPDTSVPAALEQGVVTFQVTKLAGGNTADILNTPYNQLVTPPGGDKLNGGASEGEFGDFIDGKWVGARQSTAKLTWEAVNEITPAEAWNWSLSQVLAGAGITNASRYAEATIIATMGGRSKSYNAMFLFRPSGVQVADNIININGGAVEYFTTHSAYPHALMETSLRNSPLVKTWLRTNKVPEQTGRVGGSDACDLASVRCGVTEADTASSAAKTAKLAFTPLRNKADIHPMDGGPACTWYSYSSAFPVPTQTSTREHFSGNHSFSVIETQSCQYSQPPNYMPAQSCWVHASTSMQASMGEFGAVNSFPFSHVVGEAVQQADAYGQGPYGPGNVTTPPAIAQGEVRSCFFGLCNATVTLPPVASFPADTIWTPSAAAITMCPWVPTPQTWRPPAPLPIQGPWPPLPPSNPCESFTNPVYCIDSLPVPLAPVAAPAAPVTRISSAAPILR